MGMYENAIPDEEIGRQQGFKYPQAITEKCLNSYQTEPLNWNLLDIGCGSNPALAEYVNQRGGWYHGLDLNPRMLGALQAAAGGKAHKLYNHDATKGLGMFEDGQFDVVHTRFVLMHVPDPDKRTMVIQEAVRVTKPGGLTVFMEWDWSTLEFSDRKLTASLDLTPQERAMFDFLQESKRLAELAGADMYAGKKLPNLVPAGFAFVHHQRPFGDYTDELVEMKVGDKKYPGLCKMGAAMMRQLSTPAMADQNAATFERLARELPGLRAMLRPPAICIAELRKK